MEISKQPKWKDGIYRGFTAGALLAVTENLFTCLTGTNIELRYLVWTTCFDIFVGLTIGFTLAVFSIVFRRLSATFAFSAVSIPLGITLVFLSDETALAAFTRELPPWIGILALALCLGTTFIPGFVFVNKWARTKAPEFCITMLAGGTCILLVGGNIATRSIFVSYFSPKSVIFHAVGALLLTALLVYMDKHTRHCIRDILPRRMAIHSGGLSVATILMAFATISSDEPKTQPTINTMTRHQSPPVILISVDTLRADHLSLYGYDIATTPNLERLASDGVVFENVISPANWTLPAHASLFTGAFPRKHAAHVVGMVEGCVGTDSISWPKMTSKVPSLATITRPLQPENRTLAEILGEAGYRTAAIVANYAFLNHSFGLNQGFEYYDDRERMSLGYSPLVNSVLQFFPLTFSDIAKPYRLAEEINQEAFRRLDTFADQPFFLFLNYMEPHDPYAPPRGFRDFYKIENLGYFDNLQTPFVDPKTLSPRHRRSLLALYDGEIAYLDHQLGILIERLKTLGTYDKSLIIFTSDHGEYFGEHGLWGHGIGPYEQVHQVPLIIKYPHSAMIGTEAGYAQLIDIHPTILKVAGITIPGGIQGSPLPRAEHPVITEHYEYTHFGKRIPEGWGQSYRTLYEPPWKLVLYSDDSVELFNLMADSLEQNDLSSERDDIATTMRARLHEYVEAMEPIATSPNNKLLTDKETLRKLRSLGYVR